MDRGLHVGSSEELATDALLHGLVNEIFRHLVGGAISDCPQRGREADRAEPRDGRLWYVREVKDEPAREPKPALQPGWWRGHVALPGQCVREVVEHERRLVAEHALLIGPEPEGDEVLVLAGRVVDEAEDAALDALEPPLLDVELNQGERVARLVRLRVRDVARLSRGDLEEPIPVRRGATG